MTLQKERARLIAAREEIDHTITALDQVLAYLRLKAKSKDAIAPQRGAKRLDRPPKHIAKPVSKKRKAKRVPKGFWATALRQAVATGTAVTIKGIYEYLRANGHKVSRKAVSSALERYHRGKV